jgi:DNA-binding XRE family transcriptional regulator
MDKKGFAEIRAYLGKTQKQMAQLMGTSNKAIESFEQGWRNISPHIERQLYFLVSQKTITEGKSSVNCWDIRECQKITKSKHVRPGNLAAVSFAGLSTVQYVMERHRITGRKK